jgi:class 3 adenylate cyclase/pSer/pThr/pTyr-binding forkhead associated (FHA) protein
MLRTPRKSFMQPNTLVTKILNLAREDPRLLERLEIFRRAITVMFTDIKGSTEYYDRFGDTAGFNMVHECNDLLRSITEQHGGRVVKTIGDAIMAVFDDCDQSVRAAIAMQRRLREKNAVRKKEDVTLIRVGLHYGTGIVKTDDVFGNVVNVASRVENIAQPEQIIISDSLREQIAAAEFRVVPLGRFHLKGKSEERELFHVHWSEDEVVPLSAHTTAIQPGLLAVKLQRLNRDGSFAHEYPISATGLVIDNREAISQSPENGKNRVVQARFSLVNGQPTVEDLSGSGGIFIRLMATYTLENGDVVALGAHRFKFVCTAEAISAANALGKTLRNVSQLLNEPVAQFVGITVDGAERGEVFPIQDEEISFGRINATYTFNDDRVMSKRHARIYRRGEDFFLEDLGSLNGTMVMVRGKAPVPLGVSVSVADQVFRVVQ